MRFKMTPTEILEGFLYSDGFDDLVAMRLKLSLESTFDALARLDALKTWTPYQYEDYVETLRYGRALIVVLEWFTCDDWLDATVQMNRHSLRLDSEF